MTHISSIATLRLLRSGDRLFAHWWTQTRPSSLTSWVGSLMGTHGHFDLSSTAKITTGPSANIFTNREYENMIRSLNLRRLSFVLFIGERNHFLAQLPSIQEKLVEILKNPPGAAVQSEVSTTSTHILSIQSNSYRGVSLHARIDVSTITSQFVKLLANHFD